MRVSYLDGQQQVAKINTSVTINLIHSTIEPLGQDRDAKLNERRPDQVRTQSYSYHDAKYIYLAGGLSIILIYYNMNAAGKMHMPLTAGSLSSLILLLSPQRPILRRIILLISCKRLGFVS